MITKEYSMYKINSLSIIFLLYDSEFFQILHKKLKIHKKIIYKKDGIIDPSRS